MYKWNRFHFFAVIIGIALLGMALILYLPCRQQYSTCVVTSIECPNFKVEFRSNMSDRKRIERSKFALSQTGTSWKNAAEIALKQFEEGAKDKPVVSLVELKEVHIEDITYYVDGILIDTDKPCDECAIYIRIVAQWISLTPEVNGFILSLDNIEMHLPIDISDLLLNVAFAHEYVSNTFLLGIDVANFGTEKFFRTPKIGFALTVNDKIVSDFVYLYPTIGYYSQYHLYECYRNREERIYMYPWPGEKYLLHTSTPFDIQTPPSHLSIPPWIIDLDSTK